MSHTAAELHAAGSGWSPTRSPVGGASPPPHCHRCSGGPPAWAAAEPVAGQLRLSRAFLPGRAACLEAASAASRHLGDAEGEPLVLKVPGIFLCDAGRWTHRPKALNSEFRVSGRPLRVARCLTSCLKALNPWFRVSEVPKLVV